MTTAATLPGELAKAVEELEERFPDRVIVELDDAGAIVSITEVPLGPGWSAPTGRLAFLLPFHYPDAAIYPYHVTGAVPERVNDGAVGAVSWRGAPATQISLRHNKWSPAHDTALGSVLLVMARLRAQ
jgi:hypothetical protein